MHELLAILTGIGIIYFGSLSTGEGMILNILKRWTTNISYRLWHDEAQIIIKEGGGLDSVGWLRKIIWACPYCMCNPLTWGGLAYAACVYRGFLEFDVITWVLYCLVLSGLIKFIDLTAEKMGVNLG